MILLVYILLPNLNFYIFPQTVSSHATELAKNRLTSCLKQAFSDLGARIAEVILLLAMSLSACSLQSVERPGHNHLCVWRLNNGNPAILELHGN